MLSLHEEASACIRTHFITATKKFVSSLFHSHSSLQQQQYRQLTSTEGCRQAAAAAEAADLLKPFPTWGEMLLILKVSDKPTWSPLWLAAGACQCITCIKVCLHMLQYML